MESLPQIIVALDKIPRNICLSQEFFDRIFCLLNPHEQIIYLHLLRFRDADTEADSTSPISLSDLVDRTHLSKSSIQRGIASLENRGLIRRVEMVFGKNKKQGNRYWILYQDRNGEVKWNSLPHMNTPKMLEDKIVDGTEAILTTEEKNFENCPDCHGTGFLYKKVDGILGVVRCKHENL